MEECVNAFSILLGNSQQTD